MIIDTRIGGDRAQFASQLQRLSPESLVTVDQLFTGTETDDFYEGLLAGVSASYKIHTTQGPLAT